MVTTAQQARVLRGHMTVQFRHQEEYLWKSL
jgi:hypothetical protein